MTGAPLTTSERQLRFLARASAMLGASLDYHETLQRVADLAVPELADWCAVDVLEEAGLRRVAIAHADPERERLAWQLAERYPPAGECADSGNVARVIASGQPLLLADLDDEGLASAAVDEEHQGLLRDLGVRSVIVVPMIARERTLGAVTIVRSSEKRRYDERVLELAVELAGRAAMAVDNARLHAAAQEALAEAQRVQESRARLVRGFSHDLKNPLGAADGYAQLLLDGLKGELQPQQRQAIERMRVSLRAALDLIDVLVELARTESGQLELRPIPFDARGVVSELVGEFSAQAAAAGLTLECDVPAADVRIVSDRHRVRQVLANLLSNALKYTPEGTVTVRVTPADAASGCVCFEVADTGPGIPADQQEAVFREFTRLEYHRQGAGLGLAISRRIARLLKGDIRLQSEPGAGATFTLELPVNA